MALDVVEAKSGVVVVVGRRVVSGTLFGFGSFSYSYGVSW